MTPFHLKIVTPDGLIYDGQAEELLVRTINGDIGILARHMNYVAPLGMGRAVIVSGGQRRTAACIGGMVSVFGHRTPLQLTDLPVAAGSSAETTTWMSGNARQRSSRPRP